MIHEAHQSHVSFPPSTLLPFLSPGVELTDYIIPTC